MRIFTVIWFGQLVSTIGSYMTEFALVLWAWEVTGSATALTLVGFFSQLPRAVITLFAGVIVDRCNRKHLMMLGDAIAVLSTVALLLLYATENLQIWHLYLTSAVNSSFGQIQQLAYSTSVSLMVPSSHYTRANSMESVVHYGSAIFAPALAGSFYPFIGLIGIFLIDMVTFGVAIVTLLAVTIPQPSRITESSRLSAIWHDLTFGFKYFFKNSSLRLLVLITALFWFVHDLGGAIYDPMILARSNGSAQVLASTSVAAGIGGVVGAIGVSIWGGFKRRLRGLLVGMVGAGISKTVFGLGRTVSIWIPAQFCSSLNFPLLGSSETAIWMANVAPNLQGRVFAASSLIVQIVSAFATFLAGPLADRVLEPAMMSNHVVTIALTRIFGTGPGAGMAVLYVLCSLGMVLAGLWGCTLPKLQQLEATQSDPPM
ncbi:MFS transporter [Leptolyngbya sp. NK1-12]|uniref:MFS transporter n=1 Tax=Leptolyngbya sp. NK1-12 TaxID=2547451 RepID=A0AA96WAQ4_9CYAN|nr:MFS transporter [Leptolyngbya sp. NK1-12]WNZ21634.1 MFS transporter [Leptolyngbya sp. NK1-12]